MVCGDRIARIVPTEMAMEVATVPIQYAVPSSTALEPNRIDLT